MIEELLLFGQLGFLHGQIDLLLLQVLLQVLFVLHLQLELFLLFLLHLQLELFLLFLLHKQLELFLLHLQMFLLLLLNL